MRQTSKLTYEDLLEMYPEEDNVRRELIDGEVIVAASPVKRHQYVVRRLLVALSNYADGSGGECYPGPVDVYLDETNVPEPDVVYVGPDKVDDAELRYLKAVDLVVEVSSPSTKRLDLIRKRATYERFGVPEYWFVDLDVDRVEVYRHDGTSYRDPRLVSRGGALESPNLPGFSAAVEEVLGPPPD